jgi:hypothetical protein
VAKELPPDFDEIYVKSKIAEICGVSRPVMDKLLRKKPC